MNKFMSEAKGLASNPLGIIALFISMIYGFACLVVGMGSSSLESELMYLLIWFLVLFPVIILISFLFLVVFHHQKLYAPKDYRDEENFFKGLDRKRQIERLNDEITEIEQQEIELLDINMNSFGPSVPPVMNDKKEKSKFSLVKKEYMLIEELAIRKLEDEYSTTIYRQIQVKINNTTIEADGLCRMKNRDLLFEIKYSKGNRLSLATIGKIEHMVNLISSQKEFNFKLIVVIVHESGFGEKLRSQLYGHFKDNKKLEFKFYNNDRLQESISG